MAKTVKKAGTATDKALASAGKAKKTRRTTIKTEEPMAEKDEEKQIEEELRIRMGKGQDR